VQLALALSAQVFTQCILYILLIEEDMYTGERSIVRSHAVVLESGDCVHTSLGHILLSQDYGQLLGTVVTVVEEDYHVALLDSTINSGIMDGFYKFVGHSFVVAFLHSLYHIGSLLAFTAHEQVVSHLHTLPTFVAIHSIVTTNDRGYMTGTLCTVGCQFFNESLTALGVGVASVHKAVDEGILDAIFLRDVAQFVQVVKRTVHTTI